MLVSWRVDFFCESMFFLVVDMGTLGLCQGRFFMHLDVILNDSYSCFFTWSVLPGKLRCSPCFLVSSFFSGKKHPNHQSPCHLGNLTSWHPDILTSVVGSFNSSSSVTAPEVLIDGPPKFLRNDPSKSIYFGFFAKGSVVGLAKKNVWNFLQWICSI